MQTSPIRLDCSRSGIVIVCAECPWWSAFRFNKSAAWDVACDHEERAHSEDRHQRDARDQRRDRARRQQRDTPAIRGM